MNRPNSELGYCSQCLANVQHVRSARSRTGRTLSWMTLGLSRWLSIGPWYCVSCGKRSLLFPPFRRDQVVYDPERSSTRNQPLREIERVGNFIDAQVDLVNRASRTRNYSPRYRDAVVESILSGDVQFSEIRKKLDISELDLQDWIARYHVSKVGGGQDAAGAETGVLDGQVIDDSLTDVAPVDAESPRRVPK